MRNRRAALEGLSRILDAGAPEDLFSGADEEAAFLYDLLVDAARGRSSTHYWEICRTARRRGVLPEYVVDRAIVLLAAMKERRRTDLYRVLGVPPLAPPETIRQRWLEVAKMHHPDAGGDSALFRHAKQAYEVLRDPGRRAEYERFWARALGPFERVAPTASSGAAPSGSAPVEPVGAAEAPSDPIREALEVAARVFAAYRELDRRVAVSDQRGANGVSGFLTRVETVLAPVSGEELERLAADAASVIARLEPLRQRLAALAALKATLRR